MEQTSWIYVVKRLQTPVLNLDAVVFTIPLVPLDGFPTIRFREGTKHVRN